MTESKTFNRVATILLTVLVIITLLPIILIVIASFTEEQTLIRDGYTFFPSAWSISTYEYLWASKAVIGRAIGISLIVTIAGTCLGICLNGLLGYVLSRNSYKLNNKLYKSRQSKKIIKQSKYKND